MLIHLFTGLEAYAGDAIWVAVLGERGGHLGAGAEGEKLNFAVLRGCQKKSVDRICQ